jgi:hypothetical protein
MYLFIFEDGSLSKSDHIPEEIKEAAADGLFDIVNMETGELWMGDSVGPPLDGQEPDVRPLDKKEEQS